MRVVHLATTDITGGAARSAYRLHQGLLELGEESVMLVRDKEADDPTVRRLEAGPPRFAFYAEMLHLTAIDQNRSDISNTHFSLGWPGVDASRHPLVQQADVIHLHWVAGFQSPANVAALLGLGKRVVWTLHDMRPFTGGCHFSAGCEKFMTDCADCPQLATDPARLPAAALADAAELLPSRYLQVVAPSRWLAECARASRLFSGLPLQTIPYGLDLRHFARHPRGEARRRLGLPQPGFFLLAGADHGAERRKGFLELSRALELCRMDAEFRKRADEGLIRLLCFGRSSEAFKRLPIRVHTLGYLNSNETLSAAYSAADLFVLPSLEDNLPNTILEALSCGAPVAAFRVGGIPDLIEEGRTGFLARPGEAADLARVLVTSAANGPRLEAMRADCRRHAEKCFPLRLQASRYQELYRRMRPAAPTPPRDGVFPGPALGRAIAPALLDGLARYGLPVIGPVASINRGAPQRRRAFLKHLNALLRKGAAGRLSPPALLTRLEALQPVLQGSNGWWIRARCAIGGDKRLETATD